MNLIGANSTQAWCRTYRLAFSSGRKHSRYVRPAQPGMRRPRDRSDRYLQKTSAMPWSVDAVESWRRRRRDGAQSDDEGCRICAGGTWKEREGVTSAPKGRDALVRSAKRPQAWTSNCDWTCRHALSRPRGVVSERHCFELTCGFRRVYAGLRLVPAGLAARPRRGHCCPRHARRARHPAHRFVHRRAEPVSARE